MGEDTQVCSDCSVSAEACHHDERIDDEEWRPVKDWPWYEVSRTGLVRSIGRWVEQFKDGRLWRRQWRPGKVLAPGRGKVGYLTVTLMGEGRRETCAVHQLVAETFHGSRPPGMVCRHLDGNPVNNVATNLMWGTPFENSQDAVAHGTLKGLHQWTCSRGHMLAMPNLQELAFARDGERVCKACHGAHSFVHYQRKVYGREYDIDVVAARKYLEILREVLKDEEGGTAA